MERIVIRYQNLCKALDTLNKVIQKRKSTSDEEIYLFLRDSLIKRFEYCFETFWQLLQQMLNKQYTLEISGTRNIFREALRTGLITDSELTILFQMIIDRNETVHTYQESVAETIANDIPLYFETMSTVAKRLESLISNTN